MRAIRDVPIPRGVSELKAYLGMLTYYSKSLPDRATVLAPLLALYRREQHGNGQRMKTRISRNQKGCLHRLGYWYTTIPSYHCCWHVISRLLTKCRFVAQAWKWA